MVELEDFIGFTINRDLTKTTLKISQPDLINNIIQGFDEDVKLLMTFNTPATTHKGIVRNQETDTKISYDLQKRYSSGVVSKLYLFKHSLTKLSNAVHELSKFMYKASISRNKTLIRTIKYVIDTKD